MEEARSALAGTQYDAVLTSRPLQNGDGIAWLSAIREVDASVAIVFLTTMSALETALGNVDKGGFDILVEPFPQELARVVVHRACEHTKLLRDNSDLKKNLEDLKGSPEIPRAGANVKAGHPDLLWIEGLPERVDLRRLLAAVEKTVIERTLQATSGAQAEAARRLGLSRSDLSYKLSKYELRKVS